MDISRSRNDRLAGRCPCGGSHGCALASVECAPRSNPGTLAGWRGGADIGRPSERGAAKTGARSGSDGTPCPDAAPARAGAGADAGTRSDRARIEAAADSCTSIPDADAAAGTDPASDVCPGAKIGSAARRIGVKTGSGIRSRQASAETCSAAKARAAVPDAGTGVNVRSAHACPDAGIERNGGGSCEEAARQ